ncbi:MAG: hypothetical protein RL632_1688 [Bacteroidota bacterium]|jgi:cytochrome c-type biogenesis protein CcsB
MEKFSRAFFSMRMMALAMIVFLVAIGAATMIESAYDIQTAKIIIYNALWFELLLVYLGMNLIANIFRYKMLQREKIAMLTFHLSFIVILIGAGVTRYFSFEGMMLIREGEQANFIYSADPHLWLRINDGKQQLTYTEKMFMSEQTDNFFTIDELKFPNHASDISVEYVNFQKKMIDSVVINDSILGYALKIVTDGMTPNYLFKGGFVMAGDVAISFEKKDAMPGVTVVERNKQIFIKSQQPMRYLAMAEMRKANRSGQVMDSLFTQVPTDSLVPFLTSTLYLVGQQQFVFKEKVNHAKKILLPSGKRNVGSDYLTVRVRDGKKSKIVRLQGGIGTIPDAEVFSFNGLTYEMTYGSTKIDLPFSIACRDFKLDRYPGSETASSFESEVTILDEKNNYKRNQRIFMNNVMDYQGYRFFQSSYDPDEKGTHLSVNYDWWGTNITYFGYLLMAIGMLLSLFAPVGRFRELNDKLRRLREKREKLSAILLIAVLTGFGGTAFSQSHEGHDHASEAPAKPVYRVISEEHSEALAYLLVQDFQGRIIPMHTLCDQLLRKIHRGNTFEEWNAVQTIMSMHMYPQHWMDVKIIQVPSNLRESMKVSDEFASYTDLADPKTGEFKKMGDYNIAHRKLESKRNEYDKKLIKLVEKFQVVQSIFNWQYMKIIPVKGDVNQTWYVPLSMDLMQMDSVSSTLALRYISGLDSAANTNRYGEVDDLLTELIAFQREAGSKVVPSEKKVEIEIWYNKMNVFKHSYQMYLLLGLLLLLLYFIRIFAKSGFGESKTFRRIRKTITFILIAVFVYHGQGLGARWYISGHAPWSNGYEAVVFIAWATMIAGFIFSRKNAVILAGTAILASMMIFVTEMNLLDPEITPLQPVLKSYWLMIHVAIITSSYGFLGLAAILGLLNLTLYTFRSKRNGEIVTLNIHELTYVSEMTMTIGLFMLTIGTFLGGVWANESWGRYWGWDPKETWALVSVLVYAVILHLRYIPALKSKFTFNVVSLWGYSAILFTFFGVNFYLVGLHSYAQGEGLGTIPNWIIFTVIGFFLFTVLAYVRNRQYVKANTEDEN